MEFGEFWYFGGFICLGRGFWNFGCLGVLVGFWLSVFATVMWLCF